MILLGHEKKLRSLHATRDTYVYIYIYIEREREIIQ